MIREVLRKVLPDSMKSTLGTLRHSTYAEDGLIAARITDFLFSDKFNDAYEAGKSTGSWAKMDLRWRVFVGCWAAHHAKSLPGDFVECGVSRGGMARAIIEYVNFSRMDKTFFLLDTFSGIPAEMKQSTAALSFDYSECFEDVKRTFAEFSNVQIIRGVVPKTLSNVDSKRIAFLSIDMNCVEPEIAAAEFFWSKISAGGVIVLDDYCYSKHYKLQNKAFDDFASARHTQVLALPTGQGLIFKSQNQ